MSSMRQPSFVFTIASSTVTFLFIFLNFTVPWALSDPRSRIEIV